MLLSILASNRRAFMSHGLILQPPQYVRNDTDKCKGRLRRLASPCGHGSSSIHALTNLTTAIGGGDGTIALEHHQARDATDTILGSQSILLCLVVVRQGVEGHRAVVLVERGFVLVRAHEDHSEVLAAFGFVPLGEGRCEATAWWAPVCAKVDADAAFAVEHCACVLQAILGEDLVSKLSFPVSHGVLCLVLVVPPM